MNKKASASPESLLQDHSAEVQRLTYRLREVIQEAAPELEERVYMGWHGLGYHHTKAGYLCAIFPREDTVRLAFEHGASLPDPEHRLIKPPTSSKQVRYLEFSTEADIQEEEIIAFLHAAIAFKSYRSAID